MAANMKYGYHGYLDVKFPSRGRAFPWKTWKRRWVVLQMMTNVSEGRNLAKVSLYLHESSWKAKQKERESLFLDDVTCLKRSKSRKHLYAFEVAGDEVIHLHLAGKSETETQAWMSAIRAIFWPVPAERLSEMKDFQESSVIDNECSEEFNLNGTYLLEASCTSIVLRHLQDDTVAHQWMLPSIARFYIPSTKVAADENKVMAILTTKAGQEDLMPFFFFTKDARDLIEFIKTQIQSPSCPRQRKSNMQCMEAEPDETPESPKGVDRRLSENDILNGSDSEQRIRIRQVSLPASLEMRALHEEARAEVQQLMADAHASNPRVVVTSDMHFEDGICRSLSDHYETPQLYGIEEMSYENGKLKSMCLGSLEMSPANDSESPLYKIINSTVGADAVPDDSLGSECGSEYASEYYSGDSELEKERMPYRRRSKTDSQIILQKKGRLPLIPRTVSESEKNSIALLLRNSHHVSPAQRISDSSGYMADIEKSPARPRAYTSYGELSNGDARRRSTFYMRQLFEMRSESTSTQNESTDESSRHCDRRESLMVPYWSFDNSDDEIRKASTESTRTLVAVNLDNDTRKASSESTKTYVDIEIDLVESNPSLLHPDQAMSPDGREPDVNGEPLTPPPRGTARRKHGVLVNRKSISLLPYIDYDGPPAQSSLPSTDSESVISGANQANRCALESEADASKSTLDTVPQIVLSGSHRVSVDSSVLSSTSAGHTTDSSWQASESPALSRSSLAESWQDLPALAGTASESNQPTRPGLSVLDISADYVSVSSTDVNDNDRERPVPKPRLRRRSRKKTGSNRRRSSRNSVSDNGKKLSSDGHQGPTYCTTTASRERRRSQKATRQKSRVAHAEKHFGPSTFYVHSVTDSSDVDTSEYDNSQGERKQRMPSQKQHQEETSQEKLVKSCRSEDQADKVFDHSDNQQLARNSKVRVDETVDKLHPGHSAASRSQSCPNDGGYLVPVNCRANNPRPASESLLRCVSPLSHVYMDLDSVADSLGDNEENNDMANDVNGTRSHVDDSQSEVRTLSSDLTVATINTAALDMSNALLALAEDDTSEKRPKIVAKKSTKTAKGKQKLTLKGDKARKQLGVSIKDSPSTPTDAGRKKDLKKYLGMPSDVENPLLSPPSLPDRPKTLPTLDKNKTLRRSVFSSLIGKKQQPTPAQIHARFNARHHSLVPVGCHDDIKEKHKRSSTISLPSHVIHALIELEKNEGKSDDEISLISESSSPAASRHNSVADITSPHAVTTTADDDHRATETRKAPCDEKKLTPEPFKDLLSPFTHVEMLKNRGSKPFSRQNSIHDGSFNPDEVSCCSAGGQCSHSRQNMLEADSDGEDGQEQGEGNITPRKCEGPPPLDGKTANIKHKEGHAQRPTTQPNVSIALAAGIVQWEKLGSTPSPDAESEDAIYMAMGPVEGDAEVSSDASMSKNAEVVPTLDEPDEAIYMPMDSPGSASVNATVKCEMLTCQVSDNASPGDEIYMNMDSLRSGAPPIVHDEIKWRNSSPGSLQTRILVTSPSLNDISSGAGYDAIEDDIYMTMGAAAFSTTQQPLHRDHPLSKSHDNLYMNLDSFAKDRTLPATASQEDIYMSMVPLKNEAQSTSTHSAKNTGSKVDPPRLIPKSKLMKKQYSTPGLSSPVSLIPSEYNNNGEDLNVNKHAIADWSEQSLNNLEQDSVTQGTSANSVTRGVSSDSVKQTASATSSATSRRGSCDMLDPINRVAPLPAGTGRVERSTHEGKFSTTPTAHLLTHVIEDTYMTLSAVTFPDRRMQSDCSAAGPEVVENNMKAGCASQEDAHPHVCHRQRNEELDEIRPSTRMSMFPHRRKHSQEHPSSLPDSAVLQGATSACPGHQSSVSPTTDRETVEETSRPTPVDTADSPDANEHTHHEMALNDSPSIMLTVSIDTDISEATNTASDTGRHSDTVTVSSGVSEEDPLLKLTPSADEAKQAPTSPALIYEISESEPWVIVEDKPPPSPLPSANYVESPQKPTNLASFVISKARASFRGFRKLSVGKTLDNTPDRHKSGLPHKKLSVPHSFSFEEIGKKTLSRNGPSTNSTTHEVQSKKTNGEAVSKKTKSKLSHHKSFSPADILRPRRGSNADGSSDQPRPRSGSTLSESRLTTRRYFTGQTADPPSPTQRPYQSVFQRRRRFARNASAGSYDDLNSSRDSEDDLNRWSPSSPRRTSQSTDSILLNEPAKSTSDSVAHSGEDCSGETGVLPGDVFSSTTPVRPILSKRTSAQPIIISKSLNNSPSLPSHKFRRRLGSVQNPLPDVLSGYGSAPDVRPEMHSQKSKKKSERPLRISVDEDNYMSISQLKRDGFIPHTASLVKGPGNLATTSSSDSASMLTQSLPSNEEMRRLFREINLKRHPCEHNISRASLQSGETGELQYVSVSQLAGSRESVREVPRTQEKPTISYGYASQLREQIPVTMETFRPLASGSSTLRERTVQPKLTFFTNTIPILSYTSNAHSSNSPARWETYSDSPSESTRTASRVASSRAPHTPLEAYYARLHQSLPANDRYVVNSDSVQSSVDKCQAWVDCHVNQMPEVANERRVAPRARDEDESDTEISDMVEHDGRVAWRETVLVRNVDVFNSVSSCYFNV